MNIPATNPRPKEIKVCVFAKHVDGGTGTFIEQLSWLKQGSDGKFKMKIIALERPQYRIFQSRTFQIDYFSEKKLLPYQYLFTPSACLHLFREIIWLRREIIIFQPTIILSIDNHCNMLVCLEKILFQRMSKIKLILTIHNNVSAVVFAKLPRWGRYLFRRVCHQLLVKADEIVCVSQGVARDTKNFFSLTRTPQVIHIGVDVQKIQKLARSPIDAGDARIFRSKTKKILAIGRFTPQKDFATLIETFTLFYKKKSNIDLVIIGDGPDKDMLVERVKNNDIERHVHFLGWKQNVYPYIKATDIFVLSSNYEGFPFVLLEAAVLNKPIVATDTPFGPRELLGNNKYGLVVPIKQPQALSSALVSLMNKKTYTHYQLQARKRVSEFSERSMIKRYQLLIKTLTQNSSGNNPVML